MSLVCAKIGTLLYTVERCRILKSIDYFLWPQPRYHKIDKLKSTEAHVQEQGENSRVIFNFVKRRVLSCGIGFETNWGEADYHVWGQISLQPPISVLITK